LELPLVQILVVVANIHVRNLAAGGSREERLLDADGIETALGTIFGLPVEPEWRPLIERAAALPG